MTEVSKQRYVARYASRNSGIYCAPCWYVLDRFMDDMCATGLTKAQAIQEADTLYHSARREYGLEPASEPEVFTTQPVAVTRGSKWIDPEGNVATVTELFLTADGPAVAFSLALAHGGFSTGSAHLESVFCGLYAPLTHKPAPEADQDRLAVYDFEVTLKVRATVFHGLYPTAQDVRRELLEASELLTPLGTRNVAITQIGVQEVSR